MALVGYARVSTEEQETHLQVDALARVGVTEVFQEKASSVGARPQLKLCLARLKRGDVLVVYKLDRIARSLKDLLHILDQLKAVGAEIRSLNEPLDTSSPLGVFMIQMLGAVAQLERSMIRERSIAGMLAAHARGVQLGRRKWSTPPDVVDRMRVAYATQQYTYPDIGRMFGVHPSTAKRLITGRPSRRVKPVLSEYLQPAQT
jgi:DNA invertase Pin-like site-specific DNA recombinase